MKESDMEKRSSEKTVAAGNYTCATCRLRGLCKGLGRDGWCPNWKDRKG